MPHPKQLFSARHTRVRAKTKVLKEISEEKGLLVQIDKLLETELDRPQHIALLESIRDHPLCKKAWKSATESSLLYLERNPSKRLTPEIAASYRKKLYALKSAEARVAKGEEAWPEFNEEQKAKYQRKFKRRCRQKPIDYLGPCPPIGAPPKRNLDD